MWKATATLDQNAIKDNVAQKQQDDLEDWDSDPNFVNAVSEKDQRWGRQETAPKEPVNTNQDPVAMEGMNLHTYIDFLSHLTCSQSTNAQI